MMCVECGHQGDPVAVIHPFVIGDAVLTTGNVADPVGSMLSALPRPRVQPPVVSNANGTRIHDEDLDRITQTCTHPGIAIHRFPNGETSYCCQVCAKVWPSLPDAVDDAEQTRPINMTEGRSAPAISPVVEELASELSARMAMTLSALVEATNPGTAVAISEYADFVSQSDLSEYYDRNTVANMRANTPFLRNLPAQAGGQLGTINVPHIDPALLGAGQRLRAANREAQEAMGRRQKAMEDAARAAAAAFDMGETAEPVKLETERRLKVVS